jgi:hypothetical protein
MYDGVGRIARANQREIAIGPLADLPEKVLMCGDAVLIVGRVNE